MTNIEKICQEIERLKKILEESTYYLDNSQQALGYSFALDDFSAFIDSLPEEKPSEDLEEAAREIVIKMHPCLKDCTILGDRLTRGELMTLVKAGAEWMRNQMPMPEDTVNFQKGVAAGRRLEREDGGLAWQDIKSIVQIADKMLDDPKARVEFQNHNEEYYYKKVLDEYYDR